MIMGIKNENSKKCSGTLMYSYDYNQMSTNESNFDIT